MADKGPLVSLADLGGVPGPSDAAPLFRRALAMLRERGGTLHVPPGDWQFTQTDGVAVAMDGLDGLTISGPGARILCNGLAKPFVLTSCRSPVVRGITIDWVRPPFSQGRVVSVGPGNLSAKILVDAGFSVDGSEAIKALGTYDAESGLVAHGGLDAYDVVERVSLIGPQLLRLGFTRFLPLEEGDCLVLRHATYGCNAFTFNRCADLLMEDVTIQGAPGMGVYAEHCSGASFRRLRIASQPGSGRLMSTTADGLHLSGCNGQVIVTDSEMSGMGDDCINVHGRYVRISQINGSRSVTVNCTPEKLAARLSASPRGDSLEFVAASSLAHRGALAVESVEAIQDGRATLRFGENLPPGLVAGDYVLDEQNLCSLTVSRCRFPGNRGRGVLLHSHAVVEHCQFSGQSLEAILILPDARYMEGPSADRVVIQENNFTDILRSGKPSGAISIGVVAAIGEDKAIVNRRISVLRNRFDDVGGAAIIVRSCDSLIFDFNRINSKYRKAVCLERVTNSYVRGNQCNPLAVLEIRQSSNIKFIHNKGLIPSS